MSRRRDLLRKAAVRLAARSGLDTIAAGYYSPIPDFDALPPETWTRPAPMPGVDLRLDDGVRRLEGELRPYLQELAAPDTAPGTAEGYYLHNPFFGAMDAEVLHAMIRHLRPRNVLELGSGFSTLVIAGALARNGDGARHVVVDPFPSPVLAKVRDRIDLRVQDGGSLEPEAFAALGEGDVLFVDTSHTVRMGGEVVPLLLEAVPSVAAGVVVQIHDIFRPYEYPEVLVKQYGAVWQEHYLVQAFLAYNDAFEVLLANHALLRERRSDLEPLIPSLRDAGVQPSSLWLRRAGG